jgi:hypothetical protein
VTGEAPLEFFPALAVLPGVVHAFTGRVPGIDTEAERELALQRLEEAHSAARRRLSLREKHFITARQVHGAAVAIVDAKTGTPVPEVDGLITNDPSVCLGVYVADCGPVYLVDPKRRVIALLHSGRKGTELAITRAAIRCMERAFGCNPSDLVVQLGPCIRPPHYEVDFAADIRWQALSAGVREVHDCGTCTAANVDRYYSYRREKGRTGRMVALLALAP